MRSRTLLHEIPFALEIELFLSSLGMLEIMLDIPAVARRNIFLLRAIGHRHGLGRHVANRQLRRARTGIHAHVSLFLETIGFERYAIRNRVYGICRLLFFQLDRKSTRLNSSH